MVSRFGVIPNGIDFPKEEEKTLEQWRKDDTFRESVK
jgi:hypothetical protein